MASLDSFTTRGGWWVVAQLPILAVAAVLPPVAGTGALMPVSSWAWLGVGLTLVGILFIAAGLVALGEALTPFPAPRAQAGLRTRGIYAVVRHPIYSGLIFVSLGWALWWQSVFAILFSIVVFAFFDRKAADEERRLTTQFAAYAQYRKRTRKLIPLLY